jgi:hypothetical protein
MGAFWDIQSASRIRLGGIGPSNNIYIRAECAIVLQKVRQIDMICNWGPLS